MVLIVPRDAVERTKKKLASSIPPSPRNYTFVYVLPNSSIVPESSAEKQAIPGLSLFITPSRKPNLWNLITSLGSSTKTLQDVMLP